MITDRATAALVPMRIHPTKPTARRTLTLSVRRRSRCTLDRPARRRNAEVAIYHGGASTTWRATSRQETSIQAFCCCGMNCGTNIATNCFYYCIGGEGVRQPGQMASAQPRHYAPQQTRGGARLLMPPSPTPGRMRESTSPRTPHAKATRRIPCPPAPFADVSSARSTAFSPSARVICSLQPAVPMSCYSAVGSARPRRNPPAARLGAAGSAALTAHSVAGPRGNLLNTLGLLFPVGRIIPDG